MDDKVKQLLLAYSELTSTQKDQFRDELRRYENKYLSEQRTYSEELKKSLGPLDSNACYACGR